MSGRVGVDAAAIRDAIAYLDAAVAELVPGFASGYLGAVADELRGLIVPAVLDALP